MGTSPRMRGKREKKKRRREASRNIPAYAGKTIFGGIAEWSQREHPRVCGENSLFFVLNCVCCGTSPRMRGKLNVASVQSQAERNIPAYAGKTSI